MLAQYVMLFMLRDLQYVAEHPDSDAVNCREANSRLDQVSQRAGDGPSAPFQIRGSAAEARVAAGRGAEASVDVGGQGLAYALLGPEVGAAVTPRVGHAEDARLETESPVRERRAVRHVRRGPVELRLSDECRNDRPCAAHANAQNARRSAVEAVAPERRTDTIFP
jgi:hypothetical protein